MVDTVFERDDDQRQMRRERRRTSGLQNPDKTANRVTEYNRLMGAIISAEGKGKKIGQQVSLARSLAGKLGRDFESDLGVARSKEPAQSEIGGHA